MSEKTISTDKIYNGKILTVRKDVVKLPNGKNADREIIEHNGGVCILPLLDDNTVIMVEQYRHPYNGVLLEIPAGKLEPGEDPSECGRRELIEETGYTAERFEFLGKLYPTPAYCTEVIHMYLARDLREGENSLDEDEFLDVVKMPFDRVVNMVIRNEIPDAKTQLAVLKAKMVLEL